MYVSTEGNKINWKYKIAFKTGDLQFQLGEPFPETTPDGRKVTVSTKKVNSMFSCLTMHNICLLLSRDGIYAMQHT